MKIIEALKEFKLIDKKLQTNRDLILKYSAVVDNGKLNLALESEEKQRQELRSLIQSTEDLIAYRAVLRRQLAVTNATVQVTVGAMTKTIAEWIEYRQYGLDQTLKAYNSLSDLMAVQEMRSTQINPAVGIRIVKLYDELWRNSRLIELQEIKNRLDASLEIVNATTDLIGV